MGKKKAVRKIKELSVVGSVSGEPQQQAPRKRGRPRKIIAQVEEREEDEEQTATEAQDVAESIEAKKLEGEDESENKGKVGKGFASSPSSRKEEGSLEEKDLSQKQQPRMSRAKRKNKPRKSC